MKPEKPAKKNPAAEPSALFADDTAAAAPPEPEAAAPPALAAEKGATQRAEYRLLSGRHGRFENGRNTLYVAGDRIWLTPAEAQSLGARVGPPGAKTAAELAAAAAAAKDAASKGHRAQRGL